LHASYALHFYCDPVTILCKTMASHPPQHETGSTSPDIQTFATSLQLLPDGESRVLEILAEWPKLNTTVDDADFDNQMLSFRINAGCQISREVLGESALLEKAAVQQAVSESWFVTLTYHIPGMTTLITA
jgi:hypothetical protein